MTLIEIEAFLAIIKYGTMSAAAKALFITQPALSRRIQNMEQELGYPLIKRQKGYRSIQLTDKGVEFYRIAWKWQDSFTAFPASIIKKPIFSETFVVVSRKQLPAENGFCSQKDLLPEQELYVPWNKEFKFWHADHIDEKTQPLVELEDISLMASFFQQESWSIVPYTMGIGLKQKGLFLYKLSEPPPKRIIYALMRPNEKRTPIHLVLELLSQYLDSLPSEEVQSLL